MKGQKRNMNEKRKVIHGRRKVTNKKFDIKRKYMRDNWNYLTKRSINTRELVWIISINAFLARKSNSKRVTVQGQTRVMRKWKKHFFSSLRTFRAIIPANRLCRKRTWKTENTRWLQGSAIPPENMMKTNTANSLLGSTTILILRLR